jgi:hypothetical protein
MAYSSEIHLLFILGAMFILFYNLEFQDFISLVDFSHPFKHRRRIETSRVMAILR